jgi:hypothetical protein
MIGWYPRRAHLYSDSLPDTATSVSDPFDTIHPCSAYSWRSSDSITRLSLFLFQKNRPLVKLESRTLPQALMGRYMCAGRMGACLFKSFF